MPDASITRELVIKLLLGSDMRARDAARGISNLNAWDEAVQHAIAWRVQPSLAARSAQLNVQLPQPAASYLKSCCIAGYSRSAFVASNGLRAMQHLEARGIRVAAFKGLASMAQLHAGPRQRLMNDVDLLVRKEDLHDAVRCLEQNRFRRETQEQLNEYAALVGQLPAFAGNQAIALSGPGGSEIDLHWSVGKGFDVAATLDRAETARLWDFTFPVVSMEDGALLTVRHAIREHLQVDGMCRDLIDTKLRFASFVRQGRVRSLGERAATGGLLPALLAIANILTEYDPEVDVVPHIRELASRRERRLSARLVELFHVQLHEGPLGKDLVYFVHAAPIRNIVSGLFTDGRRYRRLVREFETRLSGQPLPWAHRLAALVGLAGKFGFRHFLRIRALAQVKYD